MGGVTQPGSGWGLYGATKFALEGLSEALANEIRPLGIALTLVEPGGFRTDFLDDASVELADAHLLAYAGTAGLTRSASLQRNRIQQGDPARAVAAIRTIAGRPDPPLRLPLGRDAIAAIEAKLAAVRVDLDAVQDLATGTDFP